ncbi:MAG: enoyl-CoA hydratase/isomerase family protein [Verrucomicrobia bacterium]|nr:enoyl-CoA hydratase/isomerase family protein [Cytophagales bacterium]
MYQLINYEVQEGVCTISLNRPDVYNALNDEISFELQDAVTKAAEDTAVRVLVLTGAGKAFSSGADLKAGIPGTFKETLDKRYTPLILALRNMPKPVICKLNGVAAGIGCSLALACDIIIASEEASLTELFVGIGLVMDGGSTYFLPRLVGSARAFEIATTGRKVSATEAFQIGLINRVVAADKLDETVKQLTDFYATAPTKTIGMIKEMLNKSSHMTLEEVLDMEGNYQNIAGTDENFMIGVQAFFTKTKPIFK